MKHLVKSWLDTDSFNKLKAVTEERGVSEFIRQAIEEKISNISQNGKALKQLISNNSNLEIKEIQNQLGEVQIQNKVLFEQLQNQQELFKIILRRATISSVTSGMNLEQSNQPKSIEAKNIIDKMLEGDFIKLKL
jgi:predicted CopG family antitoxin